ncbi:MAG: L-aspartate oxidase [candidate division WOR-3 bacterium]
MINIKEIDTDFLVIGSGIAGLWFVHRVADFGKVILVTKKEDTESNTNYAQGGIAAALGEDDSTEIHINDTIKAGAGLAHKEIVKMVIENGPRLVRELYEVGVKFTTYYNSFGRQHFDLGREGGHSRRRIVHCQDRTGAEIEKGLVNAVRQKKSLNILENHFAIDLLVKDGECFGAIILDANGNLIKISAKATLLATGGIGTVYLHTTNPKIATGDGIAMAFRAGAKIANMEFIQFHPTALYGKKINGRCFLISESVRGEGGILKTADGKTFAERYHELGSLAPRDVLARAIAQEMKKSKKDFVYLDVTHLNPAVVKSRFPIIYKTCLEFGIDITKEMIPVVPAAHYVCGGIQINERGETNIPRLFAAGECACSGMHGANRLASNSLLEALFFASSAAESCKSNLKNWAFPKTIRRENFFAEFDGLKATNRFQLTETEKGRLAALLDRMRKTMWDNVGVVRSDAGLKTAEAELTEIELIYNDKFSKAIITSDLLEFRNMLIVAKLITQSAQLRKESRGLHYNIDHPLPDDKNFLKDTIITKNEIG